MGWMQKLCDVYDVVSRVEIPKENNHPQLVRVGFTKKKVGYVVTVTANGEFSSVNELGKDNCECVVPTTPEAETRTTSKPDLLADKLKYFVEEAGNPNPMLDQYLEQLADWCAQPEAPQCLKILYVYLSKRTLLTDLHGALPRELKLHKKEGEKDFKGPDAQTIICFSVEEDASHEMRLWERKDVRDSWSAYYERSYYECSKKALCYATGEMLSVLDNHRHPKVQNKAKLISAKDEGYPFRYKGRFVEDGSAATVSAYASARAHRALQYLMDNQGLSFRKFGLNIVAWNVQTDVIPVPLHEGDSAEDEDEDRSVKLPDTFEKYAQTLCAAAKGTGRTAKTFENCIADLVDGKNRSSSVVIMSMVAATDGRMSIDYYQELPDDLYVDRLTDWYRSCCWTYWDKESRKYIVRTPMPLAIADAIMGTASVRRAKEDQKCQKSDAKQLRALYKRLLSCIVDGEPLPRNFLKSAVCRAEIPLTFCNRDNEWQRFEWETCMRTACALIRRSRFDALTLEERKDPESYLPSDKLDKNNRNRDYLYGRLLALADLVDVEAAEDSRSRKLPTNAVRLMQRFVQRPGDTWLLLHGKILPCLGSLGNENRANGFMCSFGEIESLFSLEDRESAAALGEEFLLGYLAQRRDFYTPHENIVPKLPKKEPPIYVFGSDRSTLYGMLAAIADCAERSATLEKDGERILSAHDGATAALRLMRQLTQQPAATWAEIHTKLLPYLEKLGIRRSCYYIRLLSIVESGFDSGARTDNTPLNSLFLHGFYRMRTCILSGGRPQIETPNTSERPMTRDRAYAWLLAIENRVERIVLDLEKNDEENRTSNALRFMSQFAASPASTWLYLEERMRPYLKKLCAVRTGWAKSFEKHIHDLGCIIHENGWDSNEPLSAAWLHAYYTAQKR